jgi:hypothetical protein
MGIATSCPFLNGRGDDDARTANRSMWSLLGRINWETFHRIYELYGWPQTFVAVL